MRLTVKQIQAIAEKHYGLKPGALSQKSREKSIVTPRQVVAYLAKKYTPKSLREIGRDLGGLSHSTLLHGCRKVEQDAKTSRDMRFDLASLQVEIGLIMSEKPDTYLHKL